MLEEAARTSITWMYQRREYAFALRIELRRLRDISITASRHPALGRMAS